MSKELFSFDPSYRGPIASRSSQSWEKLLLDEFGSTMIQMGARKIYAEEFRALADNVLQTFRHNYQPSYHTKAIAFLDALESEETGDEHEKTKERIKAYLHQFTNYDANRLELAQALSCASGRINQVRNFSPNTVFVDGLLEWAKDFCQKLPTRVLGKDTSTSSGYKTEFQFLHQFFLSYALVMRESREIQKALAREIDALTASHDKLIDDVGRGEVAPCEAEATIANLLQNRNATAWERMVMLVRAKNMNPLLSSILLRRLHAKFQQDKLPENLNLDACCKALCRNGGMDGPGNVGWDEVSDVYLASMPETVRFHRNEPLSMKVKFFLDGVSQAQIEWCRKNNAELSCKFVRDRLDKNSVRELLSSMPHLDPLHDYLRKTSEEEHDAIRRYVMAGLDAIESQWGVGIAPGAYSTAEMMGSVKGERRKEIAASLKEEWHRAIGVLRKGMLLPA